MNYERFRISASAHFLCLSMLISLSGFPCGLNAQGNQTSPGSSEEPVRVLAEGIDMDVHDGGLRPAVGVENIQVFRANRTQPDMADGYGWTYNHAPMLAWWNGRFYLQYLSNPYGEHFAPGHTMIATSRDGRNWEMPHEVFPIYHLRPGPIGSPDTGLAMMHQRMGFYVAPNGRLLISGFYGHAPSPWGEKGIGRVVREAYRDGSYGDIYFIRYNQLSDYREDNTNFPFYTESDDRDFIEACEALLADKLATMQWWEEDRGNEDGFYTVSGHQSPSVYHRLDGKAVVHWKAAWAAISPDEGESWSTPVKLPGIITDGAKTWGQKTSDGRFALVYNPAPHGSHRWPLAIVTGDDGILFENMLLVHGEVPPRRYLGRAKDFGPQYVRGISEGNGDPPGPDMWVTYSVNKEDMWISRIPVPVRYQIKGAVADDFNEMDIGGVIPDWNIYRTQWARVEIAGFPSSRNRSISLLDHDPYDYARAVRVFEESSEKVEISFKFHARQAQNGRLEFEVLDHSGLRPVRIIFDHEGYVRVNDGAHILAAGGYRSNYWHQASLEIDVAAGMYSLLLDGKEIVRQARFAERCASVERVSFRTGPYRTEPTRLKDRYEGEDLSNPDPDNPAPPAIYHIDDVVIKQEGLNQAPDQARLQRK